MSLGTGLLSSRGRGMILVMDRDSTEFCQKRRAESSVFSINIATVIGPTPPGTAVM